MADIFSTNSMLKAVYQLPMTNNFLLKHFFPIVQQENTEKINFDVVKKTRRLAPFVSPLVRGEIVEFQDFDSFEFEPAYIKDKRILDSSRPLKRMAGERIGGSIESMHRTERLLIEEIKDQVNMIDRRMEVMSAEALMTGKLTISGSEFETKIIDFKRDSQLSVTLSLSNIWTDPASTPLDDLQDWAQKSLELSGVFIGDVVMSLDVWKVFRAHPDVAKILDRLREGSTMKTDAQMEEGGVFMGNINGFNIYVYSSWYLDSAGAEQPVLPAGTVIMSSPRMQGLRAFGAIRDDESGYMATPYYPKSWTEKDPSIRILLMQSAPLVVPTQINATFFAKVM